MSVLGIETGEAAMSRYLVRSDGARGFFGQLLLVLSGIYVYFAVRGLTEGVPEEARNHGRDILAFENRLGVAVERHAQTLIEGSDLGVNLANWVYIWLHWPVIIVALIWLHHFHPGSYAQLRNAIFVSGLVGMVIFALYPVAPPRLLGAGFIDTVSQRSQSYRLLQPPSLVNKYAAFPSLHVGWNLLVGVVVFRATQSRILRVLAVLSPLAMALAVVFTANHYVVDAVAGSLVALVGLLVANVMALKQTSIDPSSRDPTTGDNSESSRTNA